MPRVFSLGGGRNSPTSESIASGGTAYSIRNTVLRDGKLHHALPSNSVVEYFAEQINARALWFFYGHTPQPGTATYLRNYMERHQGPSMEINSLAMDLSRAPTELTPTPYCNQERGSP